MTTSFITSLLTAQRPHVWGGAALIALILLPTNGFAQPLGRGSRGPVARAVPRGSVRPAPPRVYVPTRPYASRSYRVYRPGVNLGFFYGAPGFYGAYRYGSPFWGYGYGYGPGYPYGYGYRPYGAVPYGGGMPYGYGYGGYSGRPYGGLRIDLPQRHAEVFVDGYFVGNVDNFDGARQQANLEAGPHRVEIRDPDHIPITFEVNIRPGRTITYRGEMRPLAP